MKKSFANKCYWLVLFIIYFDYYRIMENTTAIQAFIALGQESRLNIFRLLVQKGDTGLMPSQIHELLGIPNATLSFHLKELLQANLISVERQSRNLIYKPNALMVQELSQFLLDNCCGGKPCTLSSKQSIKKIN